MFLQFCYPWRTYCIPHLKHHVSGFGQYLTRAPRTKSPTYCGVFLPAHCSSLPSPRVQQGTADQGTWRGVFAPCDPLFSRVPCCAGGRGGSPCTARAPALPSSHLRGHLSQGFPQPFLLSFLPFSPNHSAKMSEAGVATKY